MPVAIIALAIGGVMVASALSNKSIADVFADWTGLNLTHKTAADFTSSNVSVAPDDPVGAVPILGAVPTGKLAGYKGPNATLLEQLHAVALGTYHLKLNNLCRSAAHNAAVGGSPTSFHVQCRGGDYVGSVTNRVAFARYAKGKLSGVSGGEVFCDQAGMVAPGFDHSDHTHIGA